MKLYLPDIPLYSHQFTYIRLVEEGMTVNWRKSELMLFIVVSAVQIAFSAYNSLARCGDDTASKTLKDANSISFVDLAEQFIGDIHHYRPTAKMHSAKTEYRTSLETIYCGSIHIQANTTKFFEKYSSAVDKG